MNNPRSTVAPSQPGEIWLFHASSYLAALAESLRLELEDASEEELLQHWLEQGLAQGLSPSPRFLAEYYLASNPDVGAAGLNPWLHWCEYGAQEGRLPHPAFPRALMQGRSGPAALRAWIAEVGEAPPELKWVEPLWRRAMAIEPLLGRLQLQGQLLCDQAFKGTSRARHICRIRALVPQLRRLVLLPQLDLGGAIRVAAHAAQLAAQLYGSGETLLLYTDGTNRQAVDWFAGAGFIYGLQDDPLLVLNPDEAQLLVAQLISGLRPAQVLLANSAAGWGAVTRWGPQLSSCSAITAQLNCRDYGPGGVPLGGYADDHLRKALPYLEAVLFDHRCFADQLVQQFALPPAEARKLKLQYQPVITGNALEQLGEAVLWAGRLVEQKRPELLAAVAQLLPHRRFELWAPSRELETWRHWGLELPNVHWCGPFAAVEQLPLEGYGAYLHTAAFEGMPNLVLELGARGMPVVACDVGGLPELLNRENGWLVNTSTGDLGAQAGRLAAALEQIFSEPVQARQRGIALQERLRQQHSFEAFVAAAPQLSSFFRPIEKIGHGAK